MTRYDAIVIGAGPAGASLSLHLARMGRSVLLVDGAGFPREKTCGEGIMPAGAAELRALGLEAVLEQGVAFEGIRYRLPDGTHAQARFPAGQEGLGIRRWVLDEQLVRAAQAEPSIDVRLGTWVREVSLPQPGEDRPVEVAVDGRTVQAPLLVGADGCRSRIRRQAGLEAPPPRRARFGVGGHFRHAPTGDPLVEVFVGGDFEMYTTPVAPDVTCAALLVERAKLSELQGDLEGRLRHILGEAGGRCADLARGESLHRVRALGPLACQATRAHAQGLILVGDAAGGLDPITGEGISLALVTSRIAADVLAGAYEEGDFSARRLAAWSRARRRELRSLAKLTRMLLFLAERPRHAARVVRALARAPQSLERLLGVAAGTAPLSSLTLRDGLRLLVGV